ncbi:nSTAND1 domain-containing NTPase [Acaryochloris marina NIES-2412]|uniref:nSTAND1 domain-containing NTPase n=1 Tax=Acaryochloris marina TaxID=155978 RepID=UPI00405A3E81
MGSESPNPPPGQFLTSLTETIAQLIRWIAELIRQRNWFKLLVLVGVGLALLAHFGRDKLNQIIEAEYQAALSIMLWGAVGLIFLLALGIAVRTLPRAHPPKLKDLAERKAIKGLRPFGPDDAEIFAQLQRERLLRDCVEVMTGSNFRFGILMGESGCGKTSFLQAGVMPQFLRPDCECCGVYVRFSGQEPLAAIRQALAKQLEIPMEWLTAETEVHPFLELLTQAVTAAEKPVVLFLDQFEQWYVHAKQPEERQPFLQGLMAWYQQPTSDVKILVSIRSDLYFHIVEIQKALDFNLGPQDVFQLAKFTPAEATQVLAVIAQTEKLSFEQSFVMELAEQELADREDGRISPVDVQILAWMIERQNAVELRAFNRQAFQKFGGVEGLLMRFLDQALMARVSEGQRQGALKVLLALTDLERQVRAGVLTVSELQKKLSGTLSPQEVREAVRWLERGDVRLITPINRQQHEVAYELAHERLIPSLLKQAGRELSAADQANQLLDRRVNEWLGNNHSRRYLFGLQELWSIKRQKPYLTWASKRPQKEKLLALSWRRVQEITGALIAICLGISIFLGWLWYVPEGQMQQVRWALVNPMGSPLDRVSDEDAVSAAIAIAKDGRKKQALNVVTKYVDRPEDQAQFFSNFASTLTHEVNAKPAKEVLSLAKSQIEKIDNPSAKADSLRAIAAAYGELQEPQLAQERLKDASIVAERIDDPRSKVHTLSAIAAVYGELQEPQLAQERLKDASTVAERIDDPRSKAHTLSAITAVYGELQEPQLAQEGLKATLAVAERIDDPHSKSSALESIAAAYGKLKEPKLAQEGLKATLAVAERIDDPYSKSSVLEAIAAAYGKLKEPKLAQEGLKTTLAVAGKINDSSYKSSVLKEIVAVYGKRSDFKLVQEGLKDTLRITQKIDNPHSKSFILSEIATVYVKCKDPKRAHTVLKDALTVVQNIDNPSSKPSSLSFIAAVYGKLTSPKLGHEVLQDALRIAEKIDNPRDKSIALNDIATFYSELKESKLTHEGLKTTLIVAKATDQHSLSSILSTIARSYGTLEESKFAHEGLQALLTVAEKIDDQRFKSRILKAIATAYGKSRDPNIAHEGLKTLLAVVEKIGDDPQYKFPVLRDIAEAYGELKDPSVANEGLKTLLAVAEKIDDDPQYKSTILSAIATAYGNLKPPKLTKEGLRNTLIAAEEANAESVLEEISVKYASLNDWGQSLKALKYCTESQKVKALATILTLWAERNNPKLINGAVILEQPKSLKNNGKHTLKVNLYGPSKGCEQYIDWWEILSEDQELLDRRTFNTNHEAQQTFPGNSKPIQVAVDQTLLVRAHLHLEDKDKSGYEARQAWEGNIKDGFKMIRLPENFATDLAKADPQPKPCQEHSTT